VPRSMRQSQVADYRQARGGKGWEPPRRDGRSVGRADQFVGALADLGLPLFTSTSRGEKSIRLADVTCGTIDVVFGCEAPDAKPD
jgi:hypothetical protein